MGLVQEIFQPEVLARLPGTAAVGHTRYSTAGDTSLMNAQPIVIDCNKGKLALGHNGNLTNAGKLRRTLEHRGSIFQTTSDTEVIVHLVARSEARNLAGALADALNQVEGAYSLLVLTRDEMYAMRDPRGFRPLGLGSLGDAWMVASETCAFDLIGAEYVRDVEPGEMVRISTQRRRIAALRSRKAAAALRFRTRLFRAARQPGLRPLRWSAAAKCWAACWRANIPPTPTSSCPCPTPACPPRSAIRWNPACRSAWA